MLERVERQQSKIHNNIANPQHYETETTISSGSGKNSQIVLEYERIVLFSFIFMMKFIINLINKSYHKYKKKNYYFLYFKNI